MNPRRMLELTEEIGEDAIAEVVSLFIDETDQVAARLGETGDIPADLHFLKGAALNLGLDRLALICGAAERKGLPDGGEIRTVYAQERAALLQFISEIPPASDYP